MNEPFSPEAEAMRLYCTAETIRDYIRRLQAGIQRDLKLAGQLQEIVAEKEGQCP